MSRQQPAFTKDRELTAEQRGQDRAKVTQELDEMVTRYDRRKRRGVSAWKHNYYERARVERDEWFQTRLNERFSDPSKLRCLEVGAGSGKNIPSFVKFGVPPSQITGNELLEDRLSELREAYPEVGTIAGNALDISDGPYDVILISTVFTSILDAEFRVRLGRHLVEQLTPEGCILWYDFSYQNPLNKDVSGITMSDLSNIFKDCEIEAAPITLTPPVALLVGPLYRWLAWVPFLRSHVVATIRRGNRH